MSRDHEYFKRNPETWNFHAKVLNQIVQKRKEAHAKTNSHPLTESKYGTVVNGGTVKNISSGVKLMTRRDRDEVTFENTSPSSNSQYSEIARSNRGTQIKTTKGSSATVFSDSKSQCLDKSPIEEADEQISIADETNMMI
ncbi:hypothetical protein RIR_jg11185.t1 [Rhizophagus irregularis DAOM 181602=DAOM 197198]|uniref:Uncharacterized protein n=1 Tax=Rhizophagus irregularis (strain DAOM 181602 / DAOM 197198 / MUCL 43194) TaxID=747089 RepID=U9TDM0_RHIID|nr:hypothetical protein RIR_jg11185.t1 [Rhizophagus irregularis DAOM 181602=DAOM 197198]